MRLLIPLTPSAAACCLFVLPLWFPLGDALKQLLGSDSAVVFLSYSPQRTTKGEAISPSLVGRKRILLTLSPCSECIPGVVCSAVHTCVSTHSEYIDSRELPGPSNQSPAFASLEPGCFQPGFSSIELSPALLHLLRSTGFFVVIWSSARTRRSFAKLGPFLFPFYLTRPPYILHLYPVCPTRAANELSLPIGSPHSASYLRVLRFLAL